MKKKKYEGTFLNFELKIQNLKKEMRLKIKWIIII